MARIAGINIPQNKVLNIALTYIHGIGLHTGNRVSMTLSPAPANTGFSFRLIKSGKKVNLKAHYTNVKSTELCTLISDNNGNTVSTVEHILSALYGLEIDNIFIDLNSNEVPVCDGSSMMFVDLLHMILSHNYNQLHHHQICKVKNFLLIQIH